jgi:hypothetical protein
LAWGLAFLAALAGYTILDEYQVAFSEYGYRVRNGQLHLAGPQRDNFRIYRYFLERIVASLKYRNVEDAAKYAGVLLHVIEDFASPSHVIEGGIQFFLVKQLFPPPDSMKYARLHPLMERGDVSIAISDYAPRLLGTSTAEAAVRILQEMNLLIIQARGWVMPIVQAIYAGDAATIKSQNSIIADLSARLAADVLNTVFCIASGRFDEQAKQAFEAVSISSWIPLEATDLVWRYPRMFSPLYAEIPTSDVILDSNGEPLPLSLSIMESGKRADKKLEHGIAAGARITHTGEPCLLSFLVPENVYDRFEALAGIHSVLGVEGATVFQVKADDRLLYDSGPVLRKDPARNISVPLLGVKEIYLITFPATKESAHNFAVWGEPRLIKKDR